MQTNRDINRLKVVLAEQKHTAKWLAGELINDPATILKWCTNTVQPSVETLFEIARILEVDPKELLRSTEGDMLYIKVPVAR